MNGGGVAGEGSPLRCVSLVASNTTFSPAPGTDTGTGTVRRCDGAGVFELAASVGCTAGEACEGSGLAERACGSGGGGGGGGGGDLALFTSWMMAPHGSSPPWRKR